MIQKTFLLVLGLICIPLILISQPEFQVEPPNWWVGMKEPNLQLMIYGKDISHLTVSSSYKGVDILKTTSPGSKNYLFVDLSIDPKAKPGTIKFSLMEDTKTVAQIDFPLLAREEGSADRKGYDARDVIYLITPDRFANGDSLNDQPANLKEGSNRNEKIGRHGGDIEGIRKHLDYIADMGFTAIWPNPVLENDMPRYSYHGYAITDFYKVDPRMGSNESYKSFCKEAAQHGIKIIKDMILNHCGSHHQWMTDPPTTDWFNYYNQPYTETNHKKTLLTDPYAAKEDVTILTDGWFVRSMPDLNVTNTFMANYLIQNSIWWIEYAGLSGIRMDTYLYPEENFMKEWSRRVMAEYPRFNITGEVWYENPAVISYWQRGKVNTNGYESFLPSLFDFPLSYALKKALMTPDSWDGGWLSLYEMLAQDFVYADPINLIVFADNHDMTRVYSQLEEDIDKLKMAMAFVLTCRGIPQIYYGTEVLMKSPVNRDDGLIRSDFPGGWPGDSINAFIGTGLSEEEKELQRFLKTILNWRKENSVIHYGQTIHFVPQDGVYVLFRYDDQQTVMIILNKNKATTTLKLDRFKRVIGHATSGKEVISGLEVKLDDELQLVSPGPMIIAIK